MDDPDGLEFHEKAYGEQKERADMEEQRTSGARKYAPVSLPIGGPQGPVNNATSKSGQTLAPDLPDDKPQANEPQYPAPAPPNTPPHDDEKTDAAVRERSNSRHVDVEEYSSRSAGSRLYTANFCTQKCLLGLRSGGALDRECLNYRSHVRAGAGDPERHPIDRTTLLRLLSDQLSLTLTHGIMFTGERGSCGALFKLTLMGFGYTFVGKGTTQELKARLQHEAQVYRYGIAPGNLCSRGSGIY